MIHERSAVKITDFGVARIQSQQMTQAGVMIGTPNYMSPEQIQGRPVDGRSDQFSLGVIAYELLTGERPFGGNSLATVVFKIMNEEPMPAQRLNPSLGWAADTVLKRALAKNPGDRYANCTEFVAALEKACNANADWRPLTPGTATDMPTVMEDSRPPAHELPSVSLAPPAEARPLPSRIEEDEAAPVLLSGARKLILFLLIGAAAIGAVWGVRHFMAQQPQQPPPTATTFPPPAVPEATQPKPSPMATPPSKPTEEPAAKSAPEPSKSEAEASKPETSPAPREPSASKPAREQTPAQPASHDVHIITTPTGASITTSTGLNCTAPCTLSLPTSRYSITATLDGYRRAMRIVETNDDELVLTLEKSMGTLAVKSTPAGATISVDGTEQPKQTPAILQLPVGHHRLQISKEGFANYAEEVDVKDSVITNVDVNWGAK